MPEQSSIKRNDIKERAIGSDSLSTRIQEYENVAQHNEAVYADFTKLTDSISWLKAHRDAVEQNKWGFGDRAFHYMWYLLIKDAGEQFNPVKCLEIGIYKGQTISLWGKLAMELGLNLKTTGISPLRGNKPAFVSNRVLHKLRQFVDPRFRHAVSVGNLWDNDDYLAIVKSVFKHFSLNIDDIRLINGYSTDPAVIAQVKGERFHVLYIDGDHSFNVVTSDIRAYSTLVEEGGYLVMDDAATFLPGTGYFKGFEEVSRACEELASLGFTNVLNIGHNRVYRLDKAANRTAN